MVFAICTQCIFLDRLPLRRRHIMLSWLSLRPEMWSSSSAPHAKVYYFVFEILTARDECHRPSQICEDIIPFIVKKDTIKVFL